ncbi:MAG TPA: ABC transporter ATP-binding protein [Chloroflexota bacterium]|nr:ABC transporter ATP-binding protein [Chloroflexota bacterium]
MAELLKLVRLSKNFSGLHVLKDVTFEVQSGERRAIIGPNGAGKTTLFNLISGELQPTAGQVWFEGQDVTGLPPNRMWARGLARTFQKNTLFFQLTAFENVRLAVQAHHASAHLWFRPWDSLDSVNAGAGAILVQLGLWDRRQELAKNLSYGEQRQLELAIALAAKPKMLLLDEPTAGMSPAETAHTVELLAALPEELTLLIIEHDMDAVFSLADRVTVLNYGEVLAHGTPEAMKSDPRVQEVYLGV